jgi:hypothetical protein
LPQEVAGRARASGPTVTWRYLGKLDLARLVRDGKSRKRKPAASSSSERSGGYGGSRRSPTGGHPDGQQAWCAGCDPEGPPRVPLTFEEWSRLEGDEDRRQQFENDYRDFIAAAQRRISKSVRFAFAWEDD